MDDLHAINARRLGLDPEKLYLWQGQQISGRYIAKSWFYSENYSGKDNIMDQGTQKRRAKDPKTGAGSVLVDEYKLPSGETISIVESRDGFDVDCWDVNNKNRWNRHFGIDRREQAKAEFERWRS